MWVRGLGAGFDVSGRFGVFGVDLAFDGGASNIEKMRELSMAVSLRINP